MSWHELHEHNILSRNVYQCDKCKNFTLQCRYCKHMARGLPRPEDQDKNDGWAEKFGLGQHWNNELCAEHDGSIASFERLTLKLDDLEEYKKLFERNSYDLSRAGKIVGGMAAGAVVFGPVFFLAAPHLAAAAGAAGLLGSASTGTAISTLSGAALTSASLAAIGGGTMAAGMVVVTAVGAGLGAVQGGVVSNSYFGQIRGFEIKKAHMGKRPSVIFVNGFLSADDKNCDDWQCSLREPLVGNNHYLLRWESKTLRALGGYLSQDPTGQTFWKYVAKLAKRASKNAGSKLNPLNWATFVSRLLANPWHTTMYKAMVTGLLLADLIARVKDTQFVLMGHSLGCRVIYYALNALGTTQSQHVQDVYLLGGAVDRADAEGWAGATKAVSGLIYNCHSSRDCVLKYVYKGANAYLSDPIGAGPVTCENEKIINCDVSEVVDGHMAYKPKLGEILRLIHS